MQTNRQNFSNEKKYVPFIYVRMGRWDIVTFLPKWFAIPLICAFLKPHMNNEDIKRQVVEALINGTLQPHTIVLGDNVQHQHRIEKVEAGGIGFQFVQPASAEPVQTAENTCEQDHDLFCRITETAYREGKAKQVEDDLRSACVSAPKLIRAINLYEALGYLDTKNLSSTNLYNLLNEHFGLAFKPRAFQTARSK